MDHFPVIREYKTVLPKMLAARFLNIIWYDELMLCKSLRLKSGDGFFPVFPGFFGFSCIA